MHFYTRECFCTFLQKSAFFSNACTTRAVNKVFSKQFLSGSRRPSWSIARRNVIMYFVNLARSNKFDCCLVKTKDLHIYIYYIY